MNTEKSPVTAHETTATEREAAMIEFAGAIRRGREERAPYIATAREAAIRLAHACYAHDNSQAVTVARALASIYNGPEARPVRLDELRWLDWALQRDLIAVMIGTGQESTPDTHIRDAFRIVGGEEAVEWFHRHLDQIQTDEAKAERRRAAADRVRRELTEASRDYDRENHPALNYLYTSAKSSINATITRALEAADVS